MRPITSGVRNCITSETRLVAMTILSCLSTRRRLQNQSPVLPYLGRSWDYPLLQAFGDIGTGTTRQRVLLLVRRSDVPNFRISSWRLCETRHFKFHTFNAVSDYYSL